MRWWYCETKAARRWLERRAKPTDKESTMSKSTQRRRQLFATDEDGRLMPVYDTSHMMSPVQCAHCRDIYDLGGVEVVARYADCDMFKTPCCGRTVDSRSWKSMPDYQRVPRRQRWTEFPEF